jgi:hypothetical protein
MRNNVAPWHASKPIPEVTHGSARALPKRQTQTDTDRQTDPQTAKGFGQEAFQWQPSQPFYHQWPRVTSRGQTWHESTIFGGLDFTSVSRKKKIGKGHHWYEETR